MQYTFAAGINIINSADYSSLTDSERAAVRTMLFSKIQPVLDATGAFETNTPLAFLNTLLGSVPDGPWAAGGAFGTQSDVYYWDEVLREFFCRCIYALEKDGVELVEKVRVADKEIEARYFVQQSTTN